MKKILLLIGSCLSLVLSNAQDRVNAPLPKIDMSVGSQLLSAKGWMLDPEGQWESRQNRIPTCLSNDSRILLDYIDYGLGYDNFLSYQLRDISIEGESYYILIKKSESGSFRYESIREGWSEHIKYNYYVLDKKEFDTSLDTISDRQINLFMINCLYTGDVINWTTDIQTYKVDIEKDIARQIIESKKKDNSISYKETKEIVFQIKPDKEKDIVRFLIYDYRCSYFSSFVSRTSHNFINEFDGSDEMYLKDELFDKCYFETEYSNFDSFIEIKK